MEEKMENLRSLGHDYAERVNTTSDVVPLEFVPIESGKTPPAIAPYRDKIMIYSIHGGDVIPPKFYKMLRRNYSSESKLREVLNRAYCVEKDWGANQVAMELARNLGLPGYWRVNIARVLLDFGRLPGITPSEAGHLDRYAINYPFSHYLDLDGKRRVLERCFDAISNVFEREFPGKILTIGMHTYDHRNPTNHYTERGTLRPEVSLIFRSDSFQQLKHMPRGLYDPLYPDLLAESTVDRRLSARISLMMERSGIAVTHNYPYYLPDGCMEVRSQIWDYFQFLRRAFEAKHEETRLDEAYQIVWDMLLDTNLRSSSSEALRSYLHMFRNAPSGRKVLFRKAQKAYLHVSKFYDDDAENILNRYRHNPGRQSSLAIEVRKDLVWRFHDKCTWDPFLGPEGCLHENVERVAGLIARGIETYFREDRHNSNGHKKWQEA